MLIHDIANYLVNFTEQDIKPDIYSVFNLPGEKLTILEILNAIGCRLKNLFGFVKINTTTETIDEGEATVNVSGDVDNLNFDFKLPRGKDGPPGPKGEPGPANLLIVTTTASATVQGEYTPNVAYNEALSNIQANKAVMIRIENASGRYYIPYSASNAEILASAGTVSGSKQSIELYTLKWTATTNIITLTDTKEVCIADGGTKGQVLVKKSNESFDTEWANALPYVPVGGVIEWDGTGLTGAPDLTTPEKVAAFYGYGTWERYAIDRVTIGTGGNYTAGSKGGESSHTLTVSELPKNIGNFNALSWASNNYMTDGAFTINQRHKDRTLPNGDTAGDGVFKLSGGGSAHNNMQPYIANYKYRRIA